MSSQIAPSNADLPTNRADEASLGDALVHEEDARLRDDIRLLGRILGDTVRAQ